MKIIKRGTPKSETVWQGTCAFCRTVAQATEKELKQRDGNLGSAPCPVCSETMNFYPLESK